MEQVAVQAPKPHPIPIDGESDETLAEQKAQDLFNASLTEEEERTVTELSQVLMKEEAKEEEELVEENPFSDIIIEDDILSGYEDFEDDDIPF